MKAADSVPSEAPPSYDESIRTGTATPGTAPPTGPVPGAAQFRPPASPPLPARPPMDYPSQDASSLYTNNTNLPWKYPRGNFCNKCKNTGYKHDGAKMCKDCWNKFYLKDHAYNPNPSLPFKYPRKFVCEKCWNTGIKRKNGKSCQDCYVRFAPRNSYQLTQSPWVNEIMPLPPQPNFGGVGAWGPPSGGFAPGFPGPVPAPVSGMPMRVPPGDPRLGGTLCGRCRGRGTTLFFLDEELCTVCGGLGRILNRR